MDKRSNKFDDIFEFLGTYLVGVTVGVPLGTHVISLYTLQSYS